jgi:hypothetical protein
MRQPRSIASDLPAAIGKNDPLRPAALFPALPLPSMVRLNTGLKIAAWVQIAQTEKNQNDEARMSNGEGMSKPALLDTMHSENYTSAA